MSDISQAVNEFTNEEREKALSQLLKDGKLIIWPGKHKRKAIVLAHAATLFEDGRNYTEKEVMEILTPFYETDPFLLRRGLIDHGHMAREKDGSRYWLTERSAAND